MTKKDLASKLAQGVRRAMQPPATTAAPESKLPAVPATDPKLRTHVNHPWDNLHPQRIWPD